MGKLGDRVRQRRLERKLTIKDLAGAAKVSPSAISELEQGRSKSSTALHRIARALGTSPEWLDGDGVAERPVAPYEPDLMRSLMIEVESACQIVKATLKPEAKADLTLSLYRACKESGDLPSRAIILEFVRRAS